MTSSFTIILEKGSVSGYFAPDDLLNQQLAAFLKPVSRWRSWDAKELLPSAGPGFRSAYDLPPASSVSDHQDTRGCFRMNRYVTKPGFTPRKLLPFSFQTIHCSSFEDFRDLERSSGLTIIEDQVLIPWVKEEGPDLIGGLLRDMASATRGVLVLGTSWAAPLSDLDPYFNRVVSIFELVMRRSRGTTYTPDYAQCMMPDDAGIF